MDVKKLFLETEGDYYYRRNKEVLTDGTVGLDVHFYTSFLQNEVENIDKNTIIVEIGASNGRNLNYFHQKLDCSVFGIEPSSEAVVEGNDNFFESNDVLVKGTSDSLPYDDESVDIVMFGFSLFWVGRNYLFRSISEADRILKTGGYLFITDFDTKNPYKRVNIHNKDAYTYKMNYASLFLSNPQYFLIAKKNYTHDTNVFDSQVQERISAQILYKDFEDNVYIQDR